MKITVYLLQYWRSLLWLAVLLYGSLAPSSDVPSTSWLSQIPHFDKLVHFGLYFGLVSLVLSDTLKTRNKNSTTYLTTILSALFLGIGLEITQELMQQGRHADLLDIVANTSGILLAALLFTTLRRLFPRIL